MAERRMFAKTIIDSDAFLDMPLSSQALYFHLSMRADDDGFINNPKKIQRMVSCADDDLKLLIAKNFIIPFESGIVVIKHWKIHNYIRNDRYKPTVYQEEMSLLETKENKAYTFGIPSVSQSVYQMDTQDRLDKVSIGKDSIEEYESDDLPPAPPKHIKHKHGEFKHVLLTDEEFEKLTSEYGEVMRDKAIKFLDEYICEKAYKSKSHYLAIRRWVIDAVKEKQSKQGRKEPVPNWMNKGFKACMQSDNDDLDEMEALFRKEVNKPKTVADCPELAASAEALKKKLQKGE